MNVEDKNTQFQSLIESLLPYNTIKGTLKQNRQKTVINNCVFVKNQIYLAPFFIRIGVHILLKLFFLYCFFYSGFKPYVALTEHKKQGFIAHWEAVWQPGYMLIRLLRSLVFLYCYSHIDMEK